MGAGVYHSRLLCLRLYDGIHSYCVLMPIFRLSKTKSPRPSNKSIREEEGLSEDSDLARNPRSNLDLNFKSDTQDGLL